MIRILLYVIATLVFLLALAVGALFTLDLGPLKPPAQQWLSDFLEREIAVDGKLAIRLGRDIRISGQNFRLASPGWSAHTNMVEVDQVEASVTLRSLFNWPIKIHAVRATGVRVYLESRDDGPANWVFWPGKSDETSDTGRFSLPIILDDTGLSDVSVTYLSPSLKAPLELNADTLQESIADDGIEVDLSGKLNDTPLQISLRGETVAEIIQMRETRFSWNGSFGEVGFEGRVAVADLLNPTRPSAELALKGPSVEYLTDRLGFERISSGPLALNFTVTPSDARMQVTMKGRFGEFEILSQGKFANLQLLENLDLHLSASGPSATHVGNLAGLANVPDLPFSVNMQLQRRKTMVDIENAQVTVGETQLGLTGRLEDFERPGSATASLTIAGPDLGNFNRLLGLPGKLRGAFNVEAEVTPRANGADLTGTVQMSLGTVQAQGTLSLDEQMVGSQFNLRASVDSAAELATLLDLSQSLPSSPVVMETDLSVTDQGYAIRSGELRMAEAQVQVSGLVGLIPELSGTALEVGLQLPRPRITLRAFGIENEAIPPHALELKADVEGEQTRWELRNLKARYGALTAEAEAQLPDIRSLKGASAKLLLSGPDLAAQLPKAPALVGLNQAFTLRSVARIKGANVDLELDLDMDQTHLHGGASMPFEDPVSKGSFDLRGNSPDLMQLAPSPEQAQPGQKAPMEVVARGSWESNVLSFKNVDLKLGDSRLRASGDLQGPPDFDRTDLRLEATAPDISRFSPLLGWPLPQQTATVSFQLVGNPNIVSLTDFALRSGNTEIHGSGALRSGETPDITLNLQSKVLDLTHYVPDPEKIKADTTKPAKKPGDAVANDGRLIPDAEVDIAILERFSGKFDITVEELILQHRSINQVVLDASAQQGALRVNRFAYTSEDDGVLESSGSVRPTPEGLRLRLLAKGENMNVGLPALSEDDLNQLPRYDVNLALLTTGSTLREMAAQANGFVDLQTGSGKIKAGVMQMFTNDFLDQLIGTLNPFEQKDPYNKINCITLLAGVEDGKLAGVPILVIDSKRLNIFSNAEVNLATEKLAVTFKTVPQRGLGFSLSNLVNPYVQVVGTLKNPRLSLDPEGTIIQGGAAVATGGLSILAIGLKERFLSSKTPCTDARAGAQKRFEDLQRRYGERQSAPNLPDPVPAER